jgi:hypothetical protein
MEIAVKNGKLILQSSYSFTIQYVVSNIVNINNK